MKKLLFILFIFIFASSASAAVYKWVDERGVANFADDYSKIPPDYRNMVEEVRLTKMGFSTPSRTLLGNITIGAQSGEIAGQVPPIEQTLVREGDFAVKLVEKLRLGTPKNEAEAETMLSSTGISPKNGWISDYPVTPDIVGELQDAVGGAADTGKLPMKRDEALKTLQDLVAEVGLSVVVDRGTDDLSEEPPATYSYYSEPTVIHYYDTYGPPIVTYYPPPWSYSYLYAWVPYPFGWTGVYFRGYYVLNNFHRCVDTHHRSVYISNHWRDPGTRRVFVIDPSRRHTANFIRNRSVNTPRGFPSPEGRRGAASIFEQSRGRITPGARRVTRPGGPPALKDSSSSRSNHMIERPRANDRPHKPTSYSNSGRPPQVRGQMGNQRTSKAVAETGFRERGTGVSSRFRGTNTPNGTSYTGVRRDQSKSFDPPNSSSGRSFGPPSHGKINSFTPPNLENRGSSGMTHRGTGGFSFNRRGW
jgi:hypothetical protein